ncbi:MAG: hypothetical protein JNJ52_13880 [Flavobacterium sp.]|nr:hypothetical protein [Flavobacterium sp.]
MKFPFNLNNPMNWVKMGLVGIIGAGAYWLGTQNRIIQKTIKWKEKL